MTTTEIKTFEDACAALNIDATVPAFPSLPEKMQAFAAASYMLPIIVGALNNSWVPDWKNDDEYKYFPVFDMNDEDAEDGFSFGGVYCCCSGAVVGSRLCFQSREIAKYAVETFFNLYKDYFVIPQ